MPQRAVYAFSKHFVPYLCHLYFHPYLEFIPPVCFRHCKEMYHPVHLSCLFPFSLSFILQSSPRGDFTSQTSVNFSSGGESTTSGESGALRKVSNRSRAEKDGETTETDWHVGVRIAARRGFHKAEAFTDGKLARRPRWPSTLTLALSAVGHKNSCSL